MRRLLQSERSEAVAELSLDQLLSRLIALLPAVEQRWNEDIDAEELHDDLWLALECGIGSPRSRWRCSYAYCPDEAVELAYTANGATAQEAAAALLALVEKEE